MRISVTVNGRVYERDIAEHLTLLRFLREELELTGTKEGCAAGECGACTVFLNGVTVNSCLVLAAEADQCGFCTSGMLMSIKELLNDNPTPSIEEIKEGIEGNFCRCTGYQQIVEAVLDASGQLTEETKGELQHVS